MAGQFIGADVAGLRRLAARVAASGKQLELRSVSLNSSVNAVAWPGPDGASFRQLWISDHLRALRQAAAFLHDASKVLAQNAEQQEAASMAGGGFGVGGTGVLGPGNVPVPSALQNRTPEGVRAWWGKLSNEQQRSLIEQQPALIGNMNGIPFGIRVEANRANASSVLAELKADEPVFNPALLDSGYPQRFQDAHAAWESRVRYLERVAAGDVRLAAYDPENHSIVEMIGDYDRDTTTVITYVPGTTTNEASFHGGGPQDLSRYLVDSDRSGGTVAFVYKGSDFPDGPFAEAFLVEADSDEFVAASAPVLARFQDAVALEVPPGAQTVGIGHSWGARNLTGSEIHGAHYDRVIALSGAAIPPGWAPGAQTEYSSFTYPDILQTVEHLGLVDTNYPMNQPSFDRHLYEAPGGTEPLDYYSIENHNLVASTKPENDEVIRDLRREIYG